MSPDVVGRRLDERFVVVNLRTNRIYELNRSASVLWELLEEGAEAPALERMMRERFDVDPETLREDIDATMRSLRDAGLVTSA